jgi:hypothetical protein
MNVLLAPVAVLSLAFLGATRQVRHNAASNFPPLNFSSEQAPAALGSPNVRSQASSMLKPALQSA